MSALSSSILPDPYVFTVSGENNQSFWLVLLVRFDLLEGTRYAYYVSVALEIVLSCFGYFVHGRCIIFLIQHKILHLNFMVLVVNFYVSMIIGSLMRLILLFFEIELIEVKGLDAWPIPMLCTIRCAALLQALFFLAFVGIERFCATVFVADYEKDRRLHISIILVASMLTLSMTIAYSCVAGVLNCYSTVALGFLPNVAAAILHPFLLNYNKRRHRRLNEAIRKHSIDEYSLSLRVQLKENIWSLEKVRVGLYIFTISVLLDVMIVFVPVLCFSHSMETVQLWTCAANVGLAMSIAASTPAGPVIIAMHTGRHPRYLRWYLGESRAQNVSDGSRNDKMDVYFSQLHKQWSDKA